MKAEEQIADKPLSGSPIWTVIGWLAFALPLACYVVIRLI